MTKAQKAFMAAISADWSEISKSKQRTAAALEQQGFVLIRRKIRLGTCHEYWEVRRKTYKELGRVLPIGLAFLFEETSLDIQLTVRSLMAPSERFEA